MSKKKLKRRVARSAAFQAYIKSVRWVVSEILHSKKANFLPREVCNECGSKVAKHVKKFEVSQGKSKLKSWLSPKEQASV